MNNAYNFNPSFMRSVTHMPMRTYPIMQQTVAPPRISSLFTGARVGSNIAAGATGTSKITFSGILNGASKTLRVINQAIPVFYQVKPIWNNARTMFRVIKGINSKDDTLVTSDNQNKNNNVKKEASTNAPTFFM